MRAVLRADASTELGSGHIMRCLTLAHALASRGWDCRFAVRPGTLEAAPALAASGFPHKELDVDADSEAQALRRLWPEGVTILIVDHYTRDRAFEAACRPWAERIMVLDDLADRPHDCDILLDQTLNRTADAYADLVPENCRMLLGTRFALLRTEFAALRPVALKARQAGGHPLRLLISLGGTDPDNITARALEGVSRSGLALGETLAVDVVVGAGSPWRDGIAAQVAAMPGTALHVGPDNLGALMARADLAIGAAGTSSWERCCLGLPTIMLLLADNQTENARQLSAAGAAKVVAGTEGALSNSIAETLRALEGDRNALPALASRAAALCDGQGALRACLSLLPPQPAKDGRDVTLRLAETHDEAILLHWQQQPSIRNLARNPQIPTADEHHRWFSARLCSEDSFITMIEHGDTVAGMLRLDRIASEDAADGTQDTDKPETFEVSIVVDEQHRGAGVGLGALRQIRAWMPEAEFRAETLPGNLVSTKLFRTAGYTQVAETQLRCPPPSSAAAPLRAAP